MKTIESAAEFDVQAIRRDFPILETVLPNGSPLTYLDNGATAQKPSVVLDKEAEVYREYYANAYRGDYYFGTRIDEELEASRESVRELIGAADPAEIIFTSGTTMSINLVANGWGRKFLNAGDEILLNHLEHHANIVPWQQIAKEKGAKVRYIPLTEAGELDLSKLDECMSSKTRMVAVTGMSNVLGTLPPLEKLIEAARAHGAKILVDGAQSIPHDRVDVTRLDIDFLAFSGHKIYGPTGVGVLYGKRELLEEMDPFLCGGHMISQVHEESSTWAALPAKFEAGTLPIAQAISLGAALNYVRGVGFDAILAHERRLLCEAHNRLAEVPGLTIYGPDVDRKGAIVSFNVKGAHPQDLGHLLNRKGVAVRTGHHCTMPLHDWLGVPATVRASFALYNTVEEIDTLVAALHFARKRLRLS